MADIAINKGRKFYVCTTPKPDDLSQSEFEALTWVQVGKIGNLGETGTTENALSYDTWDTEVTQKQKGIANAGDPVLEYARDPSDAGQDALRAAGLTRVSYAFKDEHADAPDGYTNTVIYMRGLVSRPMRPNGAVEDFDLERVTLMLNQPEIVVDPAVIP